MIELLCTITGILAGVAIVASLFHYQGERARFEAEPPEEDPERIRGIADQLQIISHNVANNVSEHSEKVGSFSEHIGEADTVEQEHLLSSIDDIIKANTDMQGQLADAQIRIVQQSEMIEQASQQARTDALTGLANRRALDEFLSNSIATATENEIVGLLLMDIDHFKNFNDSFGHTTGDAVLASFARSLTKSCGQECYSARFGGEEFAVVMTGKTLAELADTSAAIRRFISDQVISYEDLQLKITASGGLCAVLQGDTINSAYERADEGLYQSKKAGRNRGFWLAESGWTPFPDGDGQESKTTQATAAANENAAVVNEENRHDPVDVVSDAQNGVKEAQGLSANEEDGTQTEVLDLKAFLERLEPHLQQLRRAELPATAIMVEAIGTETDASWSDSMELILRNLRGIDVVCQFRRHTLCIFMPGCSQDVALDRAEKTIASLEDARDSWESPDCPERMAISIACVESNEECAQFLDRLESALDDAQDALPSQVVIHTGECCHFQDV